MPSTCPGGDQFGVQGEPALFGRGAQSADRGPIQLPHNPVDASASQAPNAPRTIRLRQANSTRIHVQPVDQSGELVALYPDAPEGDSSSAVADDTLQFRWLMGSRFSPDPYSKPLVNLSNGILIDPANSVIEFTLIGMDLRHAGIFRAQLIISPKDDNKVAYHVTDYLVEVTPVLFAQSNAPLSVAEIRSAMRDFVPDFDVLGDYESTDEEIMITIVDAVDQFNGTRPPYTSYTVANFPRHFRFAWKNGVVGRILRAAGEQRMRQALNYTAGGVTVADKDKYADYMRQGDKRIAEWETWIIETKARINGGLGWGRVNSQYAYRSAWYGITTI